ncbi:MFS transporter [Lachnospiraceae bacterium 48-42]|nr:MFS transporter [Dorea sp.]
MNRNLIYFKWYKIAFLTMLIDPIFVIYAYSEGLSANQIFILTSIESVLIILLEVPTGVISDLFGYKISMVLAVLCFIISNIMIMINPTFISFIICEIFMALYKVCASGADEAYLYLILDNKNDFTKISGRLDSVNFMITGVISIGIGYVYSLNKQYPFVLSIAACVLALVMALKLENVKEYHQKIKSAKQLSGEFIQNIRRGFQLIFLSGKLRWFVFYSAVISFALIAILETYQLFFSMRHIPVEYFGIIYFFMYVVSSISGRLAHYFKRFNEYRMFILFLILLIITPLFMLLPAKIFIVTIIIPRIVIGIYPSIMKEYINKEIETDRATIFSIRSLLSKLPQVVLLPYIGCLIDGRGLNNALAVVAGILFVSGVILLADRK